MATLPPRRNSTPTKPSKQRPSPCQTLVQMGFSENRAEKALAATGLRGIQLASDWLFAHVNDSTLDIDSPREYVLYLCPTGPLCDQIRGLWDETLFKCGWNAAHNLLPHITLCPFFKCSDRDCEALTVALRDVCAIYQEKSLFPTKIKLEKYISPNYIGLFLEDNQAQILKNFSEQFADKIRSFATACTEASRKELHLTLAYNFQSYEFSILESLAQSLDVTAAVSWEVRMYSRDTRIIGNDVYRVLYSHVPREPDELELLRGDFVYINGDALASSIDGWVEGISWLTGSTGFLPRNYIKRTSESDAWTLLRSIPIVGRPSDDVEDNECVLLPRRPRISLSLLNLLENSEGSRRSTDMFSECSSTERLHSKQSSIDSSQNVASGHSTIELEALYAKVDKFRGSLTPLYKFPIEGPRKLIVVRHGERVDFTFSEWLRFSFDENGKYKRCNQNMPVSLPKRVNAPLSFFADCPLTNIGLLQARLIGDGFSLSKTVIHHVYCSPSLRCVQTCTNILKGLGIADRMPINIEPGLFEWLAWYTNGPPIWMTHDELLESGFNINTEYTPLMIGSDVLKLTESCEQFYNRNAYVTQSLLNATQKDGGNVLFVGHASTVDTCTRQLVGGAPRTAHNMTTLIRKVPYCSVSCAMQNHNGTWLLCEPPSQPVTHAGNNHYDWKILL